MERADDLFGWMLPDVLRPVLDDLYMHVLQRPIAAVAMLLSVAVAVAYRYQSGDQMMRIELSPSMGMLIGILAIAVACWKYVKQE